MKCRKRTSASPVRSTLAAAGIPILEGRAFSDSDLDTSLPVAVVSRTFAERHWPGRTAVGESVQIVQAATSAPMQVVGVVGDVKHFTLDAAPTADLYVPLHQMPASQASLLAARTYWIVRARAGAVRLGPAGSCSRRSGRPERCDVQRANTGDGVGGRPSDHVA